MGVNLQTPLRNNKTDPRGKEASSWLVSTRRLVETVIGQLTEQIQYSKSASSRFMAFFKSHCSEGVITYHRRVY